MPLRTFTADASSGVEPGARGTFAGMKAKIPHLKELGVTAVELLPVFEYDELEFQRPPNNPRSHMVNIWGYSHMNFFSPMSRFGSSEFVSADDDRRMTFLPSSLQVETFLVLQFLCISSTPLHSNPYMYPLNWTPSNTKSRRSRPRERRP